MYTIYVTTIDNGLQEKTIDLVFYFSVPSLLINLKKSWGLEPVASIIFAILLVEGHLGCSYLENLLLLLKVVGSRPLSLANPEQDIPCSFANSSMACQI